MTGFEFFNYFNYSIRLNDFIIIAYIFMIDSFFAYILRSNIYVYMKSIKLYTFRVDHRSIFIYLS